MKTNIKLTLLLLLISATVNSQLSKSNTGTYAGFNVSLTGVKNASAPSGDSMASVGPYFGIGVDVSINSYERGDLRFFLSSKGLTTDLIKTSIMLFNEEAYEGQIEFSGLIWGRVGINIFATDNICIGLGGNLSDYILDIPLWNPLAGNGQGGLRYEEPSGWHITAGPTMFLDYGYKNFTLNTITSYNFGFYYNTINADYEAFIDVIDGYEKPQFISTLFSLNHTSGAYASFEYTSMIDKGIVGNKMSRKEFTLGWKFIL